MYLHRLKSIFLKDSPFTIQEGAQALSLSSSQQTAKILSRLAQQGHLKRIKRGVYLPVSHKALTPEEAYADPWSILPVVFPQGYIGGWSAANFWQLTEQVFNITCVLTTTHVPHRSKNLGRFQYTFFKIKQDAYFGIDHTWREQVSVPISDIHKTIIDILQNPQCGAGIQHTVDCFKEYMSEHFKEQTFIGYAAQIKNGSFFKRLGYLSEKILGKFHPLCKLSRENLTKGYIALDSHMACPTLITRWNLYINEDLDL